jgi:hypothetical protein
METRLESMEKWLSENVKSSENDIEKEAFNDSLNECRRLINYELKENKKGKITEFLQSVLTSENTPLYIRKQAKELIKEVL